MQNLDVIDLETGRAWDHLLINYKGRGVSIRLDTMVGTVSHENLETLIAGLQVARDELDGRFGGMDVYIYEAT